MNRPLILLLTCLTTNAAMAGEPASAANAAIPTSYKNILRFETRPHKRQYGAFDAVVPAGWAYDADTKLYTPPKSQLPPNGTLIGFSSMRISTTCAGTCADKDWASIIERKVQDYRDKGYHIERDERPTPDHRLVVSKHADKRTYARFFSKSGANRYFVCEAEVDRFAAAAEAAFDAACAALVIHDWK